MPNLDALLVPQHQPPITPGSAEMARAIYRDLGALDLFWWAATCPNKNGSFWAMVGTKEVLRMVVLR